MKKTAKKMRTTKSKTLRKAAPKKPGSRQGASSGSRPNAKSGKRKSSGRKSESRPKRAKGLTVSELFRLKRQSAQEPSQSSEAWKHKKPLPPHEAAPPEAGGAKGASPRKSGFGGVRHH